MAQHSPCYSAVTSSLTNPLSDCSNYSPFCHTHYLTPDQYFTSLFGPDPLPTALPWIIILHCCSALLQNLVGNSGEMRTLNNKQRQVLMFLILLFKLSVLFSFLPISFLSLLLFSIPSLIPLHHLFFLFRLSSYGKDFKFHYILFHQWHIFCILFYNTTYFLIMHSISL